MPAYLRASPQSKVPYSKTDDNRTALIAEPDSTLLIDYGFRYGLACTLQKALADLSMCLQRATGGLARVTLENPEDSTFGVTLSIERPTSTQAAEAALANAIRRLEFLGRMDGIALMWAEARTKKACTRYENGARRMASQGELVSRNFGVMRRIGDGFVIVET